jgi:O-antigen/teichoic acid export membrane protein
MKQAKKFGVVGAWVGFCMALILAGLAYYLNLRQVHYNLDALYELLAPPSLMLMATETAGPLAQIAIVLIFATSNAALYGIGFFLIGLVWVPKRSN